MKKVSVQELGAAEGGHGKRDLHWDLEDLGAWAKKVWNWVKSLWN